VLDSTRHINLSVGRDARDKRLGGMALRLVINVAYYPRLQGLLLQCVWLLQHGISDQRRIADPPRIGLATPAANLRHMMCQPKRVEICWPNLSGQVIVC